MMYLLKLRHAQQIDNLLINPHLYMGAIHLRRRQQSLESRGQSVMNFSKYCQCRRFFKIHCNRVFLKNLGVNLTPCTPLTEVMDSFFSLFDPFLPIQSKYNVDKTLKRAHSSSLGTVDVLNGWPLKLFLWCWD